MMDGKPYDLPRDIPMRRTAIIFTLLAVTMALSISGTEAKWRKKKKEYKRTAQFILSEYAPYGKSGTGVIHGQAFLKTMGGNVKVGAGNKVYLNPVTSYSTEWYKIGVLQEKKMSPPDSRINKYGRNVIADAEGRFTFKELPAGDYYIACIIKWSVPTRWGLRESGGYAHATIHVSPGEIVDVIVTG